MSPELGPQRGFIEGPVTGEAPFSPHHPTITIRENGASGNGRSNDHGGNGQVAQAEIPDLIRNPKEQIFQIMSTELKEQGFRIVEQNLDKPWGGYLTIADEQTPEFIQSFFPGLDTSIAKDHRTTPKILVVYPGEALSWQFHERRTEFHRIIRGSAGIFLSETNIKPQEPVIYEAGEVIRIPKGMRHGTIGNGQIAIIAEIWEHTDPANPSNEEDIHRISDRYGRAD